MKKFNLNDSMYIQITELGFDHLVNTVGYSYIMNIIAPNAVVIKGETWYKFQCWDVFNLFTVGNGFDLHFKTNVLFDTKDLSMF